MSLVSRVVEHLQQTKGTWRQVCELDGLVELGVKSSGKRHPTLYVFLSSDSPDPDVRGTGPYLQSVTTTLSVIISIPSVNGIKTDIEEVRRELRKALFGYSPDTDVFEPFWLGQGRLLNVNAGVVNWIDNFITEYTEDQNSYGS